MELTLSLLNKVEKALMRMGNITLKEELPFASLYVDLSSAYTPPS
jgi:hypothetical protein